MTPNSPDTEDGGDRPRYRLSRRALLAATGATVVGTAATSGTVGASGPYAGPFGRTYGASTVDPTAINTLTGGAKGDGGEGEGEEVGRTVPHEAPEATGSPSGSAAPAQTDAATGGLVTTNFEGMNALDVRGVVPSDAQVAAGPDDLVQAINSQVGFFEKTGAQPFQASLDAFFATASPLISDENPGEDFFAQGGYIIFDPRARYDPDAGRFLLACVDFDLANLEGAFLIAVSSTDDPMDPWYTYRVPPLDATGLVDYPQLGYDGDAVYLTQNFFDFDDGAFVGFGGATMVALDKTDVTAGTSADANHFTDLRNPGGDVAFTVQPTDGGGYFANSIFQQGQTVTLWSMDDPLGTPTLSNTAVGVDPYANPTEGAEQPDTEEKIDMGDDRVLRANYDGSSVWVSHTIDDGRARWYEIDPASGTVVGSGAFRENGEKTFYPAIVSDGDDAVFVYNRSNPGTNGDGYVDLGVASVEDDRVAHYEVVRDGENDYDYVDPGEGDQGTQTMRWGDYNGAVPDPSGGFWVTGQYAKQVDLGEPEYIEDNVYGIRIAKVEP